MKDNRLLEMQVFKLVIEAGGFTAAAHALGLSQPFVSQTIANLERRLGVKLLHRSTRGHRLTAEGQHFLNSCRRILEELEQAEAEVSSARGLASGDLRVSAPLAFGLDQIVPKIPQFMSQNPEVIVHLALTDSLSNLIEDNIDVAIRMGQLQDSALKSRKLCNLQRIVVASPDYITRYGAPETPEDLAQHVCLMWDNPMEHLNRWPFMVEGLKQSVTVRGNFRSTSGQALFSLCSSGGGIMRLAEHLAVPAIKKGKLAPLLTDYQAVDESAVYAVFLPEREVLPRVRLFVDYLVDVFRDSPWVCAPDNATTASQ